MTRSRVADWAIGALAMVLLLIIAVVILFWALSQPATDATEPPPPTVTAGTTPVDPPADLGTNEIWLGDIDLQSASVVLPDASLVNVEAQGQGARSGPDGVVVEQLEVRATVPFADVAMQLGGDSRVSPAPDGQATIERTVDVLGRQMGIVATGVVEVEDGLLVMEPRSIDLGGPEVLSRAVAAVVRQFVTIKHPIEGLPVNLVLQDVQVEVDGFRVHLTGNNVVLAEGGS
ncbi:LmeA family phospholipid-binding protein [Tessaracoccus sp.]